MNISISRYHAKRHWRVDLFDGNPYLVVNSKLFLSLEEQDIASLTKELDSLGKTLHSNFNSYKNILGEEKAKTFKEEIEKIKLNF